MFMVVGIYVHLIMICLSCTFQPSQQQKVARNEKTWEMQILI